MQKIIIDIKSLFIDIKNWFKWKKFINRCRYLELTFKKRTKENTNKLLRKKRKKRGK